MFEKVMNVFRVEELRNKITTTVLLLLVYRVGFQIPIPGISQADISRVVSEMASKSGSGGAFGEAISVINMLSAGGILSFGIFSLGIMPYISSSIIFSILGKVIPSIEKMVKEGSQGQKKLNQWMRWGTVPICLVQSVFILEGVVLNPDMLGGMQLVNPDDFALGMTFGFYLPAVIALTAGGVFLMWVGEQITEYGVGNGISLLIMAGILAGGVSSFQELFAGTSESAVADGVLKAGVYLAIYLAVSLAVVYITKGARRIPIQYARMVRGRGVYGGQKHFMPLKVNQANVMPVIFAASLMMFPTVLFSEGVMNWGLGREMLEHTAWTYNMLYVVMIFFFSFFWVKLMFQPEEIANNLKEYGSFIPGIRPGKATSDYIDKVVLRPGHPGGRGLPRGDRRSSRTMIVQTAWAISTR